MVVQWLGLRASTARDPGSIPGPGTKILHAVWCGQKEKKKSETERERESGKNQLPTTEPRRTLAIPELREMVALILVT